MISHFFSLSVEKLHQNTGYIRYTARNRSPSFAGSLRIQSVGPPVTGPVASQSSKVLRNRRKTIMDASKFRSWHGKFLGFDGPDVRAIVVVAIGLVRPTGELLMAKRPPGKLLAGLWELPGGKVEVNETIKGALAREVEEELGISVKTENLIPFFFNTHDEPSQKHMDKTFSLLMATVRCASCMALSQVVAARVSPLSATPPAVCLL